MIELLEQIEKCNEHFKEKTKELEFLVSQKNDLLNDITNIDKELIKINTEKVLLENSSLKALNLSKDIMEEVSTNSLRAVFDDNREVIINLGTKSGQRTAELLMIQDGYDTDPAKEEGGGVADIVSLTSFLALGDLLNENYAPLFLDEPNKFLSKEYSEKMAIYLKEIMDYTGKQMFLVTHDEHLKNVGDISFKMTKIDKTSYMEVVYGDN